MEINATSENPINNMSILIVYNGTNVLNTH